MKKLTIISYCIFLLIFSVFSFAFIDPNLHYFKNFYSGFAFSQRPLTTIFYILSIIIFFIFYSIFIYLGVKRKIVLKKIAMLTGITAAILFFSYPAMLSYDIFNYIATSKVLFFYRESPYIVMPIEFANDSLLAFTHAANKIALYGPFWLILSGVPYYLGFGEFVVMLFSFKLFIAIFYLATVFLIWKISKNIISIILFAFNPLVIIETLVSGHNDIVMVFFALFSILLLKEKKVFFALLLLTMSILIKYATVFLISVFIYSLWKTFKGEEINWKNIFYFSSLLMFFVFFLSPIREEIYPWYAIWFLSFSSIIPNKKILLYVSLAFSFGLLLRYVPFMFSGTHASLTPVIKTVVTFVPPLLVGVYFVLTKKLWGKIFYRS